MSANVLVVLVVDDDELFLKTARSLCAGEFRVLTATRAEQAFAVLDRERIDVVVTDYEMPGMNGAELLMEVRHFYPHTRRVLMSGGLEFWKYEGSDIAEMCIAKPDLLAELVPALRVLLATSTASGC